MSDLWTWVRADVLRRLSEQRPDMPHEMQVIVAEDAAREVLAFATQREDGKWPLDP